MAGKVYQERDVLPSGRKTNDVAILAEKWWNDTGRRLIHQQFNMHQDAPKVRSARANLPGIVIPGDKGPLLRDGILDGAPWSRLTDAERSKVMAAYEAGVLSDEAQARAKQYDEDQKLPQIVLTRKV